MNEVNEFLDYWMENAYYFIPAYVDVPQKQIDIISRDYRRAHGFSTLIRSYVSQIKVSNMLARNDVIFPVIAKEYATLGDIFVKAKAEYTKLLKHQSTKLDTEKLIKTLDKKVCMNMAFDNIKYLSEKLSVDVDYKELLRAEPYEYSVAFLRK